MHKEEQQHQMEINLKEEIAGGVYTNLAIITHSDSEFVMDFISVMPGMKKGEVRSRIIMSPKNAKSLLNALSENIRKYEEKQGDIQDAIADNDTIPILGNNGGLA